jgi:hypothetical protein
MFRASTSARGFPEVEQDLEKTVSRLKTTSEHDTRVRLLRELRFLIEEADLAVSRDATVRIKSKPRK